MPDTNSPEVISGKPGLLMRLRNRWGWGKLSGGWTCPDEYAIAGYVDGELDPSQRGTVEAHLARCERCRLLVADVVKARREPDLPAPPVELRRKAASLVGARTASWRWLLVPAGAVAGIALLIAVPAMLRKPEQLALFSPPIASAPPIARSEAPAVPDQPVRDIVRKPGTVALLPSIVSPVNGGIVRGDRVNLIWNPVLHSRTYEVRIVTSDGDLVWQGQTDRSTLQLPAAGALKEGSYFVWVTAYLADGQLAKSSPVRFMVKR